MSLKEKIQPSQILGSVAKVGALGFAWGVVDAVGITWWAHRELTHHSMKVHPLLQKAIDLVQRTIGLNSKIWAAAHRIHHRWTDVSVGPIVHITEGINWINANPDKAGDFAIPEEFPYLDPYVDRFKRKDVLEIGNLAIVELRERMGKRYRPAQNYTHQELEELLNPKEPIYLYPKEKHKGEDTSEYIADMLLRDPHSPVLVRKPNGVRFILTGKTGQYNELTRLFETYPDLMPKDLQTEDGQVKEYGKADIALGFAIPSLAIFIARGEYTPKGALKAFTEGGSANFVRIGLIILGGRLVNSLGHAGMMTEGGVAKAIQSQEYKPEPYPDGTIATDSSKTNWLKRVINKITLDEVIGQWYHHQYPGEIAYTPKKGIRAWGEAFFGSLTSALARSKYFPLISPGDNFNLKPGERRPDQPHPAVEMIQRLRAEQLAAQKS